MPDFSRLNPGAAASAACSRRAAWWSSARASPRSPWSRSSADVLLKGLTPQMLGLSCRARWRRHRPLGRARAATRCWCCAAARRHRGVRRAVPALAARAASAHDARGNPRGIQGKRGLAGNPRPHPRGAARAGARPHDAGSAEGRRGRHQPDALRRGAALRREAHARAASWWPRARTLVARKIREVADRTQRGRSSKRRRWRAPCIAASTSAAKCRPRCTSPWRRCSPTSTSCAAARERGADAAAAADHRVTRGRTDDG